jgi:hypothetical protein
VAVLVFPFESLVESGNGSVLVSWKPCVCYCNRQGGWRRCWRWSDRMPPPAGPSSTCSPRASPSAFHQKEQSE